MFVGLKWTVSRLALVAGASVLATSALAADLGGDCCADLEERVAELEATTVRKGNRVMSVTLYGQVNRAIIWHDDDVFGTERQDFVFIDNDGRSGTRFGLRGSANLSLDLSAGYRIEIDVDTNNRRGSTRGISPEANTFGVRLASVYIDSQLYGRVTLGQQSAATDGIAEITLASPFTPFSGDGDDDVSDHAAAVTPDVDGDRVEGIRYDSPVLAGFTVSAFYGQEATHREEEDTWSVALRYANEFNGVRLAAGVGYRDEELNQSDDKRTLALSGSLLHVPTGIYLNGGYASVEDDRPESFSFDRLSPGEDMGDLTIEGYDFDAWYVGFGITGTWSPLGATTIGADYGEVDYDGLSDDSGDQLGDKGRYFGFGVTQNIDATATDVYVLYRNYELDTNSPTADIGDVNIVTTGMRVRF